MLATIRTQAGKVIEFEVESYSFCHNSTIQLVKPRPFDVQEQLLQELRNSNFSLKVGSIDWRACRLYLFINDVTQGGPFLEVTHVPCADDWQASVRVE